MLETRCFENTGFLGLLLSGVFEVVRRITSKTPDNN